MPHTSRKKRPPSHQHKRLEITDSAGWTHVTTTGNARRLRRNHPANNPASDSHQPEEKQQDEGEVVGSLSPAEAPHKITLTDLQRQLGEYRQRWEGSSTWDCVKRALNRALPLKGDGDNDGSDKEISIVCIGLGSPSGFLRGGWVDRRSVSMYQLAALTSIMGWIGKKTHTLVKAYAQDPVFNTHDKFLLESSGITVLEHPGAFENVSSQTFLFCPGAERRHLELLLARDPAVVFGGPLEDIESDVVRGFVATRDSVQLALFEEQEHAFWRMRVYSFSNKKG